MAREPGVTVATFGDMMRVPGSFSCLQDVRSIGSDVRVVYSVSDALDMAIEDKRLLVVFLGIGFETTCPTVAATLTRAASLGVDNFLVLPAFKLVPPAMMVLASQGGIDGFICPGHVSAIIGSRPYDSVAADHGIPCVVTGFDAVDILEGIVMLLHQRRDRRSDVEIQYSRVVTPEGNPVAQRLMYSVFTTCDARWRGIGSIAQSGLDLRAEYSRFDATRRIHVDVFEAPDLAAGCECGKVMRGLIIPPECSLFSNVCVPSSPVGPCMVSSEGACAAYHRYGGWQQ
jgi:hydrogenase expression/formation protein HypD